MKQIDRVLEARTALKYFNSILHGAVARLDPVQDNDRDVTIATDGVRLIYNSGFVSTLTDRDLLFSIANAAYKIANNVIGRRGDRDHQLWAMACDYVVNLNLIEQGIGTQPANTLLDARFAGLSTEQVYDVLKVERDSTAY